MRYSWWHLLGLWLTVMAVHATVPGERGGLVVAGFGLSMVWLVAFPLFGEAIRDMRARRPR